MRKTITLILLLGIITLTGCSKKQLNTSTKSEEQLTAKEPASSLIKTDNIGPEGGLIEIKDRKHPLSGLSLEVDRNTFDSPVDISIEPIVDVPEMKGCEVYRGVKIFSDKDISIKSGFLRLMLPFKEKRRSDMEVKLVYPYFLSSSEWSEKKITPLPGPSMDIFVGAIFDISSDIVYFPVKCDLLKTGESN